MIRLSAGTAACIGLTENFMNFYPTTAYLLNGEECTKICAFCPQGSDPKAAVNRLGRVTWPDYSRKKAAAKLATAREKGIKRICLQSVRQRDGIEPLLEALSWLRSTSDLPLSLSAWLQNEEEAVKVVEAGVERISIAIDAVNPDAYRKYKGGRQQERLDLLLSCAQLLPGRMTTHIICGLGETELEVLTLIDRLLQAGVTVALFAFIPLRGTALAGNSAPEVDSYRRVQAGYHLLHRKAARLSDFDFMDGRLTSYNLPLGELEQLLESGTAFETSGCPDCNRPYYNERPGGTIYNYHYPLDEFENRRLIAELIGSLKR